MKKYLSALAALSLVGALYGCDNDKDAKSCVDKFDCATGEDCVNQICVKPVDTGCVFDSECGSYTCNQTTKECNSTCTSEAQCASGLACSDAGFCVGEGNHTYSSVLLISRTPDDKVEGSCRAENPGPDIDYVELISGGNGVAPTNVSGAHGGFCGSAQMGTPANPWAEPSVALERTSIPDDTPGPCVIANASQHYFFMGIGQAYTAGETIGAATGYLTFDFGQTFDDGDQIKVWEVNGNDGDEQTCTNVTTARAGDIYGLYLVSDKAPAVAAGTKLDAPNFIYVGDNIGVSVSSIVLD